MKNLIRYFSIIIFAICCVQVKLYAQENSISKRAAYQLVARNADALKLTSDDMNNIIVSDAYYDKFAKTKMVYIQQAYQGIPVYNAIRAIAFKDEKLISFSRVFLNKVNAKTSVSGAAPSIAPEAAVTAATGIVNMAASSKAEKATPQTADRKTDFGKLGVAKENITAKLLWVPDKNGKIKLCWQVDFAPFASSDHWLINVDASNGTIVSKNNLTVPDSWNKPVNNPGNLNGNSDKGNAFRLLTKPVNSASFVAADTVTNTTYRVIPFPAESISHTGGTPSLVTDPWENAGADNLAATLGWHNDGAASHDSTRGNNVWAREDTLANDGDPEPGAAAVSTTASPSLTFDFPFDSLKSPKSSLNEKFAITQLFYWNNIMHDITYQYGFDEPAGNFQNSNLGRGGAENDYVIADAQDGSATNNADFDTPEDGRSPRMQMFLWSASRAKILHINSPASIAGYKTAVESDFSTKNKLVIIGSVTGNVALYDTVDSLACDSLKGTPLSGEVALIYRGGISTCNTFTNKVKNAQIAGAIAAIVVNNRAGDPGIMIGPNGVNDNTITIPAVMITQSDGNLIKADVQNGQTVNVTLKGVGLDGDLDNGIISHEYTHGVSTRLTGGPSSTSCLVNAEQMGEGWSDYFALMATTNWSTTLITDGTKSRPLGTYVLGEDPITGAGIRKYPYSTDKNIDPWSYEFLADSTGGEVHLIGEIWATVLWDMTWNIIQMDGINVNLYNANAAGGNSVALKLVTEGMKLQTCTPGFLDGRDAILKADTILYNGKYSCAIWKAFAGRGMGINAKQGSSDDFTDQVADYSPNAAIVKKSADKIQAAQNEEITYTLRASCKCGPITNYQVTDTLAANVTYVSGGTYNSSNRTVKFTIPSLNSAESEVFTLRVTVNNGTYTTPDTLFYTTVPNASVPAGLTATASGPDFTARWRATNAFSHSAPYSLKATDSDTTSRQTLTSASFPVTGQSTLSFWHYYNTEPTFDGGIVQISEDNGLNWQDAGPFIIKNGYNSVSAFGSSRWFSGQSDSNFIQTVVDLTSFNKKNIKIRFVFTSDKSDAMDGWYIDDILLQNDAGVYNMAQLFDTGNLLQSESDTVTMITNTVLPLLWGSFTAQKQDTAVLLKWTTIQEHNTAKFIVERSTDALQFSPIGTVKANGESNLLLNYSLIDGSPADGVNYYRIRAVDKDGQFTYSQVVSVKFEQSKSTITVMPNPATDRITIIIAGNNKPLQARLINSLGQVVESFVITGQYTQHSLPDNVAGIYYLKITGDKVSTVKKLVVK